MPTLRDAKIIEGIGAILTLLPEVSIVGYILILIALKFISDETRKPSIFQNALYGVIAIIIGLAIFGFSIFTAIFSFNIVAFILSLGLIFIVAIIALIIGVVLIRRSLDETGNTFNIGYFKTAGLLLLIGAILSVIIIGFLLIFIAEIFLIIAFFSLPDQYVV